MRLESKAYEAATRRLRSPRIDDLDCCEFKIAFVARDEGQPVLTRDGCNHRVDDRNRLSSKPGRGPKRTPITASSAVERKNPPFKIGEHFRRKPTLEIGSLSAIF